MNGKHIFQGNVNDRGGTIAVYHRTGIVPDSIKHRVLLLRGNLA